MYATVLVFTESKICEKITSLGRAGVVVPSGELV